IERLDVVERPTPKGSEILNVVLVTVRTPRVGLKSDSVRVCVTAMLLFCISCDRVENNTSNRRVVKNYFQENEKSREVGNPSRLLSEFVLQLSGRGGAKGLKLKSIRRTHFCSVKSKLFPPRVNSQSNLVTAPSVSPTIPRVLALS
ncbi:MAG: hypothetical protein ACREEM_48810, partial [Blastocatellia bacterium]